MFSLSGYKTLIQGSETGGVPTVLGEFPARGQEQIAVKSNDFDLGGFVDFLFVGYGVTSW